MTYKTVIFDSDGVLVDSAPAHVQFCEDMSDELGLELPKRPFRDFAEPPMSQLLRNYGFPESVIPNLMQRYTSEFSTRYTRPLFSGVPAMIGALRGCQRKVFVASSNVIANLEIDLEQILTLLHGVAARDQYKSKAKAIGAIMQDSPGPHVMVGDMPSDFEAAQKAGCGFIGVSYGWVIRADDQRFPIASGIKDLVNLLG